jgi:hypothetical protein
MNFNLLRNISLYGSYAILIIIASYLLYSLIINLFWLALGFVSMLIYIGLLVSIGYALHKLGFFKLFS